MLWQTSYDGRSKRGLVVFLFDFRPCFLASCPLFPDAILYNKRVAQSLGRELLRHAAVTGKAVSQLQHHVSPGTGRRPGGRTLKCVRCGAARRGAGRSFSTVVMRMVMMGDRGGAPRADGSLLSWHGCSDSSSASFVPYLPTQLGRLKYVTQTHLKNSHMGSG